MVHIIPSHIHLSHSLTHSLPHTLTPSPFAGPLSNTVTDFWRLIWQEDVQVVVMAANLVEGFQQKCEMYWPQSGSATNGPFTITLTEQQVFADYVIRTFQLQVRSQQAMATATASSTYSFQDLSLSLSLSLSFSLQATLHPRR